MTRAENLQTMIHHREKNIAYGNETKRISEKIKPGFCQQ